MQVKKCERADILDLENEILIVCKCLKCGTEKVVHYLVSLGKQGK
ncbi:hypothetical protein [Balnearium lithotrophicum]|nr:hypothetical protein [Balnearium lithotrophicum]